MKVQFYRKYNYQNEKKRKVIKIINIKNEKVIKELLFSNLMILAVNAFIQMISGP
jgi:hypothetical protein